MITEAQISLIYRKIFSHFQTLPLESLKWQLIKIMLLTHKSLNDWLTRKSSCGKLQEVDHPWHNLSMHHRIGGLCLGVPPSWPGTSHWVTPWKGHGTSGSIMGCRWGTPREDMRPVEVLWDGDGVPSLGCEQTGACENSIFLIVLLMWAVKMNRNIDMQMYRSSYQTKQNIVHTFSSLWIEFNNQIVNLTQKVSVSKWK